MKQSRKALVSVLAISILAISMLLSLTACASSEKTTVSKELVNIGSYELLLCANSQGAALNASDQKTFQGDITPSSTSENMNLPNITKNIFKKTQTLKYTDTTTYSKSGKVVDSYSNRDVALDIDRKTGYINLYFISDSAKDENYVSEINLDSSEDDYIKYANKILKETAGFDSKGWNVTVGTIPSRETYDPQKNNKVTVVYFRIIDGIKCSDTVQIDISPVNGEILLISNHSDDSLFEPFLEAKINRDEILSLLDSQSPNIPHDVSNYEITGKPELLLLSDGNKLYTQVTVPIKYSDGEYTFKSVIEYIVEVAELRDK